MPNSSAPKNICVVRLSAIGDTCHALAVVRAIQDSWPDASLTWIIGKTEAGLMADIADIEFIIFDKRKGFAAVSDVKRALGNRKFDAALCMHASMRTNLVYRAINAPLKLGFDRQRARDFQWLFTNKQIPAVDGQHVLDGMMSFAHFLGVRDPQLRWDIPLSENDLKFANAHTGGQKNVLLISPCSSQRSRNFRNWSVQNYARVASYAHEKYGCPIILTGGPTPLEKEYAVAIRDLVGDHVSNLVAKTTLKQLLALIAASRVVICPDSGPAHMATAVATPVIGLYATSNPDRSGPYLSRHHVVNAYPQAVGRFLGKSPTQVRWGQRVRDADAMSLVKCDDVESRIDEIFDNQDN